MVPTKKFSKKKSYITNIVKVYTVYKAKIKSMISWGGRGKGKESVVKRMSKSGFETQLSMKNSLGDPAGAF